MNSLRGKRLQGKGKGFWARGKRASRVSLAPKTPFPFPFKRLPRRLGDEKRAPLKTPAWEATLTVVLYGINC